MFGSDGYEIRSNTGSGKFEVWSFYIIKITQFNQKCVMYIDLFSVFKLTFARY